MLNPFICGSFHSQELEADHDQPWSRSPPLTPRKSRKNSKNPYSSRGLDKFSALLAELEEKRQKIYAQMGPQDISMVRFVYSSSNDCVPIVVKVKDQKQDKPSKVSEIKDRPMLHNSREVVMDKLPIYASSVAEKQENKQTRLEKEKQSTDQNKKKKWFAWNLKFRNWRRPSYYMPVAIILILLFLVFFGRSVAILCTSLGWYLVPTFSTPPTPAKIRPTKEKQYLRRFSEIKMVNNNNNGNGAVKDQWAQQHGHRKSF